MDKYVKGKTMVENTPVLPEFKSPMQLILFWAANLFLLYSVGDMFGIDVFGRMFSFIPEVIKWVLLNW